MAANRIPPTPHVQSMMTQRRFLQSQGQLARKEFMLHDRNSWPTIPFPSQMGPQGFNQAQQAYANNPQARQGFYPPGAPQVPPPSAMAPGANKHVRPQRPPPSAVSAAMGDFSLEDEDVSSGDLLDLLAPRDISKMRYMQHHEWMDEIFSSPYAISQITPVSLGLGRKGELETLTEGIFDAPAGEEGGEGEAPEVTKLEPAKAEEFTERVAKKVADMTAEIDKLKKQHARRMERFNRSSLFKDSELRLREAAADPAATGTEVWRLEGRIIIPDEESEAPQTDYNEDKAKFKVDDVVREVESAWKKQIKPEPKVSCVEKGGLLEKIEPENKDEPDFPSDMVLDHADQILNDFGSGAEAVPVSNNGLPGDMDMDMDQLGGGANGDNGDWVMVNNENKDAGGVPGDASLESTGFDFTNIDSAGDALAAYTDQNDVLDLPEMDSAFGDAFHASDNEHHHPDADEMS